MKFIKHIISAAALVFAVASCSIKSEDAFSTAPVAPELEAHAGILMTKNTMDEDVAFTWSAARFFEHNGYTLYAAYGESEKAIATTGKDELVYKVSKTEFKEMLYETFPELPTNTSFDIAFKVGAKDLTNGEEYVSAPVSISVYAFGDAIVAVVAAVEPAVVLDKETPSENLDLLVWTPAILEYNQDVTYNVFISVGDGEPVKVAEGLTDTSFGMTVDALNEAVVAAGGAEDVENNVEFTVYAFCEDIPAGVASSPVTVKITTYTASFPEKMWLPGSYQNWDPATAPTLTQSTKTKGLYQGFVDLTVNDPNGDVKFKFSAAPSWSNVDFGFNDVEIKSHGSTIQYVSATSSSVSSADIVVPSGMYYIQLDKKFGKLTMVQVVNLEIIGSFAASSWQSGIAMTWNADGKYWIAPTDIEIEDTEEFKFRFNSDWTFAFGGSLDNVVFGEGNIPFNSTGTYKISLKAETSDFSVNAVDVNMPDFLVMAGNYSGHSWSPTEDMSIVLKDKDKGIYKGYATMYGCTQGFKFVKNGSIWYGGSSSAPYEYSLADGDNLQIADGTYYWEVDMFSMTAKATPLTSVSIIGDFSSWAADEPMTFDEETLTYNITLALGAGEELKFRFNGDWAYNLGADSSAENPGSHISLVHEGANILIPTDGTYNIVLDMAHGSKPSVSLTKN